MFIFHIKVLFFAKTNSYCTLKCLDVSMHNKRHVQISIRFNFVRLRPDVFVNRIDFHDKLQRCFTERNLFFSPNKQFRAYCYASRIACTGWNGRTIHRDGIAFRSSHLHTIICMTISLHSDSHRIWVYRSNA